METYFVSRKKNTASKACSVKRNKQNTLIPPQIVVFLARKNQSS